MNNDDIALFEKQKAENTKLFNDSEVLKHELSESGKNLYKAKNLLVMCRSEKQGLHADSVRLQAAIKIVKEERDGARKQLTDCLDSRDKYTDSADKCMMDLEKKNKMLIDANEVLRESSSITHIDCDPPDTGNTYWPFYSADLEVISISLFFSVCVICWTVYKIAQMIGF